MFVNKADAWMFRQYAYSYASEYMRLFVNTSAYSYVSVCAFSLPVVYISKGMWLWCIWKSKCKQVNVGARLVLHQKRVISVWSNCSIFASLR